MMHRQAVTRSLIFVFVGLLGHCFAFAELRRKVIINEDCSGPGGSNMQTLLVMVQSPQVEVLGITVVSGNQWRDEEVARTLRLLEIIGRTDIPVVPGAVFPLVNSKEETARWEKLFGKIYYKGAWNRKPLGDGIRGIYHGPSEVPALVDGNPTTKASREDAAHFI